MRDNLLSLEEGLVPASNYVACFVDSPLEASPSLRNRWEWGGNRWEEEKEGKEGNLD